MPFPYVASVREHFGAGVVERLSRGLQETPSAISRGLDVAIPRVVAGVVTQGETESGARALFDSLGEGRFDAVQLGQMAGMLDGGAASTQLSERGQSLFPVVLGARQQEIIGEVASSAELRPASARSLLGLIAPLALGELGKRIHEGNLDVEGVRRLLAEVGQPDPASPGVHAIDAGAGPSLGTRRVVGEPGTAAGEVPPHRPDVAAPPQRLQPRRIEPVEVRRQLPLGRWLLPAALALLLVLGWSLMRNGTPRQEVAPSGPVASAPPAPAEERGADEGTAEGTSSLVLPDGTPLNAPPDSALAQLAQTLESSQTGTGGSGMPVGLDTQRFSFEELSFNPNSARLDPEARATVAELARLLEAYPDVRIRMEGHASAEVEEDPLALSQARADAVRDALETQGIQGSRIESVGHGASDPIAQGGDEEGRRKNARTDIILIGHRGR